LQLLVDKVDAELLEAVFGEDLEAVDVQHAETELRVVRNRLVHLPDQVNEELLVNRLHERVASRVRFHARMFLVNDLARFAPL
jgi:hypothetical protein